MTRPRKIRVNITAAYIPFLSRHIGDQTAVRSVEDTNYVITNAYSGEGADKDIGIPLVTYAENVMPAIYGFTSVSYKLQHINRPNYFGFNQAITLRSSDETRAIFTPAAGENFVNNGSGWQSYSFPAKTVGEASWAYIKQNTYICYKRNGVYTYNFGLNTFTPVTFLGLNTSNVDGITSANSYTIAWNSDTVFWSSAINPADFIPSLSSGAGSQKVLALKGAIVACLPLNDGFIIYTTANAVAARYTQNIRFPWNFTEIPGSAGINRAEEVTHEANYEGHFAWTHSGLQLVTPQGAKNIFPEITDFLTCKRVEEWIGETGMQSHQDVAPLWDSVSQEWETRKFGENHLVEYKLLENPQIKLAFISSRYLAISYGYRIRGQYDYVIVYDFSLKRYGKLKFTHVDCFQYYNPRSYDTNQKENFGFLTKLGAIYTLDFSSVRVDDSVLLFGALRHTRGQDVYLLSADISNIKPNECRISALPSLDMRNYETAFVGSPVLETRDYTCVHFNCIAQTYAIQLKGTFELVNFELTLKLQGRRQI